MHDFTALAKSSEKRVKALLAWGRELWRRKCIWILVLIAQIALNIVGQFLPNGIRVVLMASSGAVLLGFSIYSIYTQRSNILVVLLNILLLYFNYSLVAAVYWNTDSLESIFDGYTYSEFLKCINIELLFYGAYALLLKDKPTINKRVFLLKGKANYPIVAMCSLYIAVAPLLFYNTKQFGVRGIITPLYEYALIFMVVGLRFCRRDIKGIVPLLLASMWIILHGLMHGERVLALQMMIVWGIYLLLHVLSIKLIVPLCAVGVLLFTVFGIFRGVASLEESSLQIALQQLLDGGMANDTSYYAYWASMSITRFAQDTPFFGRLFYLIKYIGYIFFGSIIPNVNLSTLSAQVYVHTGGGWLPFYAFCWLGAIGAILAGAGVAVLINKVTGLQEKRCFCNYLSIYLVATAPRWYLYAPAAITRGMLFFTLLYCACTVANRLMPILWKWIQNKLASSKGKQ